MDMIKLGYVILLVGHYISCAFFFISVYEKSIGNNFTWVEKHGFENYGWELIYL